MQRDVGGSLTNGARHASYLYLARYGYTGEVQVNSNLLRVLPRTDEFQTAEGDQFLTIPAGREMTYRDAYGNKVLHSQIDSPHHQLVIACAGRVRLLPPGAAPNDMDLGEALISPNMLPQFVNPSPMVDPQALRGVAVEITDGLHTLLTVVNAIVWWVADNIEYTRGVTSVVTRAEEVYRTRQGVCQDMSHLAIALLRSLWIPARYVSGLLVGEVGQTHAWLEFWHPQAGWVSSDPTRKLPVVTGPDYIRFAVGRDYTDVPPVMGEFMAAGSGYLDRVVAEARLDAAPASLEEAIEMVLN